MALSISGLKLDIQQNESSLMAMAARALAVSEDAVRSLRVVRMSLDARKKDSIHHLVTVLVELSDKDEARILSRGLVNVAAAPKKEARELQTGSVPLTAPVVIAGLGPAGLFAGLTLAQYGYKPLILERGRDVDRRAADVEAFMQGGRLDVSSNIMFGAGGAGTFSDGKLTTRIKDPRANDVVEAFARFGAPGEILVSAKPHIGTDRLKTVVKNICAEIVRLGGAIRYETRLDGLNIRDGKLMGVWASDASGRHRLDCAACILAVGQGARDTYGMLLESGVQLVPKPFAVGVRIEHPRELIDRAQFGRFAGHPRLGAAEYHLADKHGGRGVYTFCMCPGGVVVPSSSDEGEVVVNGMSSFDRAQENSNAAVVVQVDERDFGHDPLAGVRFQRGLEEAAFKLGGGDYSAPAQRVENYLTGGISPFAGVKPSYRPSVKAAELKACLPGFVYEGVASGIKAFGSRLRGFDLPDAVVTAVESRTSSPVRILRSPEGEAVGAFGLYPVGEGAGYAGGIVSAAVDGMKAAERIIGTYKCE